MWVRSDKSSTELLQGSRLGALPNVSTILLPLCGIIVTALMMPFAIGVLIFYPPFQLLRFIEYKIESKLLIKKLGNIFE